MLSVGFPSRPRFDPLLHLQLRVWGKGCSPAAAFFLLFNLDAATFCPDPHPLPNFIFPGVASLSGLQKLSEFPFVTTLSLLPHSHLSTASPPQDQLLFLSTAGSDAPLIDTNSWEPGLGQSPAPFRPGIPTCSPASGKGPSVSQKSVKFLEVSAYILLHAPLEIMI